MPAFTPIRHFIDALRDGETNITRRIKYLVINYNDIPKPVQDLFKPGPSKWDPNVSSAIPDGVKNLLKHKGECGSLSDEFKLSDVEVDHIDDFDVAEKAKVLLWVDAAKGNLNAEIWWELRRQGLAGDDADYNPSINPLKITARTYAGKVNLHPLNLGSITYGKK